MGEDRGFFASFMDDFYWGAPFHKMIKVIDFVQKRGPDFGYHLNLGKSFYLMSPTDGQSLTEAQLDDKIDQLVERGLMRENIRVHPDCYRSGEWSGDSWGLEVLGSFTGHHDYVDKKIRTKLPELQHVAEVLLKYPYQQGRFLLHTYSFNPRINYLLRNRSTLGI